MVKKDRRIDAYIAKSADFARPILRHLRLVVHNACPDVEESIKWGFPHFGYHGMLCSMAAFKQHCAFGFWKAAVMSDSHKIFTDVRDAAMGHLGQIRNLSDLPSDGILTEYINEGMKLNEQGIKLPAKAKGEGKRKLRIPRYFLDAVRKNKKAQKTFNNFSYTNKKDYVEWVTEAKGEDTRLKRLATAIAWMAEGKVRNWKYIR